MMKRRDDVIAVMAGEAGITVDNWVVFTLGPVVPSGEAFWGYAKRLKVNLAYYTKCILKYYFYRYGL